MSLDVHLGAKGNILQAKPDLNMPTLSNLIAQFSMKKDSEKLKNLHIFNVGELSIVHSTEQSMKDKLMEVLARPSR